MYKSNVGDYPLKDYPCKYWWVRYAVVCNYLTESFSKIWDKRLKEIYEKYNILHFSYRGIFSLSKVGMTRRGTPRKSDMKLFLNSEILVIFKDKTERVITSETDEELYNILLKYIQDQDKVHLVDCPYEEDKQSKCPFYKVDEFYKDIPLEELRKRKGYEL